ncbi:MAG: hypothetical protein ACOCYO_01860 [Bacteroidota bacterium]
MKNINGFLIFLFVLLTMPAKSQSDNYDWWIETHDWDGVTHWTKYLIYSSEYFGPNALPVPETMQGLIKKEFSFEMSLENHRGYTGDITNNLFAQIYFPLFSDKAGINFSMVPVEFFNMNNQTRDKRRARNFDGKGHSVGDLYIGTHIQLVENNPRWPDILLTINMRTASGSNLMSARFTDTPGYFFDLSFGKTYELKGNVVNDIRTFGLLGFYVWQTNSDILMQNDAFMYGLGAKAKVIDLFYLTNIWGGYIGYKNNGDQPMLYRILLESAMDKKINYLFKYQKGLNDFPFHSFQIGFSAKPF